MSICIDTKEGSDHLHEVILKMKHIHSLVKLHVIDLYTIQLKPDLYSRY